MLRPLLGPAAELGGDEHLRVRTALQVAADQLLAAAVAVDVGGVEEGDTGLDRGIQHRQGVLLPDVAPVGTELPGAESHYRHRSAGSPQNALFHGPTLSQNRRSTAQSRSPREPSPDTVTP